jgi:hypothetical protein
MLGRLLRAIYTVVQFIQRQPRAVQIVLAIAAVVAAGLIVRYLVIHHFCTCPNGQYDCGLCSP